MVRYAAGLTPDVSDFTTSFTSTGLRVNGQNIEWLDSIRVRVYSVNEEGQWKEQGCICLSQPAHRPEQAARSH